MIYFYSGKQTHKRHIHTLTSAASAFKIDSCGTGGGNPSWYKEGGWSYHEGCVRKAHIDAQVLKYSFGLDGIQFYTSVNH